ncbi:serine dehydratase-like isoform X2 [Numida meleagris]|uniref:serine dehydratase-like isoform X2 n=1 Tax=Numida meleagris TaxID=8996 RepID=UPI000B3DA60B|nr:serine dehydratase-like isoform X2 [Numida meleagris]
MGMYGYVLPLTPSLPPGCQERLPALCLLLRYLEPVWDLRGLWDAGAEEQPLLLAPCTSTFAGFWGWGCSRSGVPSPPQHSSSCGSGMSQGGGEEPLNPLLLAGGNAGMAAAYVARKLGLPATVVVPSSTGPSTVRRLEDLGATVEIYGKVWDEANQKAVELAQNEGWASIHPFDHPLLWQGHASLVLELKDTLDVKPDAIVLAVGGGGLLAGVVAGLQQVGWLDVPIIAAETWGAHSFHAALKAGHLVTLPDITSVAKCLGAKTVSARALQCAQEIQVISEVVEDAEAVRSVERFLDDERMLVQPACGAALALLYSGRLQQLQREGRLGTPLGCVVLVVCGGSSMTAALLRDLKSQLGLE